MVNSILVAIDGLEHADHALSFAIGMATKWYAQLTILSVIPTQPIIPDPAGNYPIYLPKLMRARMRILAVELGSRLADLLEGWYNRVSKENCVKYYNEGTKDVIR